MAAAIHQGIAPSTAHTSLLCTQANQILHCEQVQVRQATAVPSSTSMEKEGLVRSLDYLEKQGITVRSLTTGLKKKLKAAAKFRNCAYIQQWIHSIINHLYWVAAMGQGDGDLIVSMWKSLVNHICDQHHGHERPFTECLHGPLEDRAWMTRGSPAFQKLRRILESPRLPSDLRHLSPGVQTYSLESFNSLPICFAPKSVAYSPDGMKARAQPGALHYNENATRHQASTRKGALRWKVKLSKAMKGHFTVAPCKTLPSYGYVDKLVRAVMMRCEASSYWSSLASSSSGPRLHMTDTYEKPAKEELIATRQSRFSATALSFLRKSLPFFILSEQQLPTLGVSLCIHSLLAPSLDEGRRRRISWCTM
ncbi:uncharacterized protein LOC119462406 isoform X2 [Dermacentor silvarum]|uniref:uncharacterized protein LOC119462406 isoform X2 n=1 Tax=Dermacentor silvarum TaxID=543639 RepID=UPI002101832F|nr:uncharacterized protein LOC119462406 isoform X2 [Dermacentor silvarum]